MFTVLQWLFTRFGMDFIKSLANPFIIAVIVGGFTFGGGIGWFRAKTFYSNNLRAAQAEAELAKKTLENEILVKAQASMAKQLEERNAEKERSDAKIAQYDKVLADLRASGKCVDQVDDELLGRMSGKGEQR